MEILSTNCCLRINLEQFDPSLFGKRRLSRRRNKAIICGCNCSPKFLIQSCSRYGTSVKNFASKNQTKKSKRRGKTTIKDINLLPSDGNDSSELSTTDSDNMEVRNSVVFPSRDAVLQACTVTSGLIGALGVLLRQVSHFASSEGWPIADLSTDITFHSELWHLGLIAGSVMLVSSCRFVLLKTWPDFADSSEAANRQVLTSLEPLDYLIVAFLPGISEEILFRGALLPVLGINLTSIVAVAALFGILHIGSGRKYSFAIWATFVGVVYGYGTALSSSIIVPMASHALNNLVGGIIWRYTTDSTKQID